MFGWDIHSSWAWYLLLAIPLSIWGQFWLQRTRVGTFLFGNTLALRKMKPGLVARAWWLPGVLRTLALLALVVAISRPQKPNLRVVSTEGVDVMIALDMSGSMNAVDQSQAEIAAYQAETGENPKNRFAVASDLLIDFIKKRAEGGDRVGLIVFGRGAYLKSPLTTEYRRLIRTSRELKLDDGRRRTEEDICLNRCTISGSGTALGDALRRGFLRLRDSKSQDRSIILITDGDDMGSKFPPQQVSQYMSQWACKVDPETKSLRRPMPVYTFLVGAESEASLPSINRFTLEYVRDRNGLNVYDRVRRGQFKTNPELLESIAKQTGGTAFQSYDESAFREQFEKLEKTVFKRTITNFPEERFMGLAWLAFALLVLELFLRTTLFRKFP